MTHPVLLTVSDPTLNVDVGIYNVPGSRHDLWVGGRRASARAL
jgi:hypothetical protein